MRGLAGNSLILLDITRRNLRIGGQGVIRSLRNRPRTSAEELQQRVQMKCVQSRSKRDVRIAFHESNRTYRVTRAMKAPISAPATAKPHGNSAPPDGDGRSA